MTFVVGERRVRIDFGHLLFVGAIGFWCVWYLFDARSSSTNLQNLLLIQPAVIVAVLLVLVIVKTTIHVDRVDAPPPAIKHATDDKPAPLSPAEDRREILRVFGFMALLAVYLCVIPLLGLDVATFLFVAACLLGQGERRPHFVIGIPLIFTIAMVYGFKALLPIPIPTLIG